MKKITLNALLFSAIAFGMTGCLKDKGFDTNKYGINDPDTQPVGVAFPLATKTKNTVALNAGTPTNQEVNEIFYINLESGKPAPADIHVVVTLNDGLRTAYNTANGTSIVALPAAYYSISSLNVTIPAGKTGVNVPINFPTTVPLDPSSSYGLGLTISSVDGNYRIASNMKNLFLEFTLKNKYDGNYVLRIKTVGWAAYSISDNLPGTWPSNGDGTSIGMITGGPNSSRLYDYWGFDDFIQPAFGTNNATATGFGATAPRFTFNTATDALVNVSNDAPDDGRGRAFRLNTAITDSRYDPATKKIYAAYIMSQNGRPDQFIYDTLTYRGPRP